MNNKPGYKMNFKLSIIALAIASLCGCACAKGTSSGAAHFHAIHNNRPFIHAANAQQRFANYIAIQEARIARAGVESSQINQQAQRPN